MYPIFIMSYWFQHKFQFLWCFILLWLHFVKLGSHPRDCNSHDDWLSCHNIIRIFVKPIWSCPLDYTNFILFNNVKILSLTYVLSPTSVHFLFLFFHQYYLVIFVKFYDHTLHFSSLFMYKFHFAEQLVSTHLYDHIANVWYFHFVSCTLFFMYSVNFVCIYICILYCSSLDHPKPYASH